MKTSFRKLLNTILVGALMLMAGLSSVQAEEQITIKPGYPLLEDQQRLGDDLKLNRAIELFLWGLPVNQSYAGRDAMFEASGGGLYDIVYIGGYADHTKKLSTLNNETVYAMVHIDLEDGPVVYDAPATDAKGYMFGSIIDLWQVALSDVGVPKVSPDLGKGGKYLILPPGYDGKVPEGYFPIQSPTYQVCLGLRSVMLGDATLDDAIARVKTIKVYPLSDPNRKQKYIDVLNKPVEAEVAKDLGAYKRFHAYINKEPIQDKDKYMVGMLASLGIEKGKDFPTDQATLDILKKGADLGWMTAKLNTTKSWEPSYLDGWLAIGKAETWTPDYLTDEMVMVDRRAAYFTAGIWPPKNMGTSTFYTHTFTDNKDKPLVSGANYKMHLPADVPVNSFWSVILYDAETFAMIDNPQKIYAINSLKKDLVVNDDKSVDVFIGPDKPKGDNNWIPTTETDFWIVVRFYGPDWERLGKTWTTGRPELLN